MRRTTSKLVCTALAALSLAGLGTATEAMAKPKSCAAIQARIRGAVNMQARADHFFDRAASLLMNAKDLGDGKVRISSSSNGVTITRVVTQQRLTSMVKYYQQQGWELQTRAHAIHNQAYDLSQDGDCW